MADIVLPHAPQHFSLVCGNQVTCHNTSGEGGVRAVLSHDRRVLCVLQQDEGLLLTGTEDGAMRLWDLRTSAPQQQLERAHSTRIRGMVAAGASSTGRTMRSLLGAVRC
jgi:hypothetical protein